MKAEKLIVTQKWSNEALATLDMDSASEMEQKLQIAEQLRNADPLPKHRRIQVLQKLTTLIAEQQEEFATLIANEGGKPLKDARVEVARAIDGVHQAIAVIRTMGGKEIPMGMTPASDSKLAFTTLEPIGIVVAISAFNHPLNLIIHQVIPAVAAGCPVIVKPAANTPLTCIKLVELLGVAGLPAGWAQVAIVGRELAEQLVTDTRIAFFSFIGSARVGWSLKSKLANGVRCALEHGGVAPVILGNYQDIDGFVAGVVKASMYHSGQVCVSAQRIYVPKTIARAVAEKIAGECEKLVIGDAILETTDVGPMINSKEVLRTHSWVQEAKDEGCEILTGGEPFNEISYKPTVLFNPSNTSKVSVQEIFAPVVCVYEYENIDDAINLANSLETSFQASIFSDEIDVAFNAAKKLQASAVMINDYTTFRVDWMPFAGRKSSGYGVGGIDYTIRDMLEDKMIMYKAN